MLKDELAPVIAWIRRGQCVNHCAAGHPDEGIISDDQQLKVLCSKAREAWAFAVFDSVSDEALRRYFTYHLTILAKTSGEAAVDRMGVEIIAELTALADHLCNYHHQYLDQHTELPKELVVVRVERISLEITFIKEQVGKGVTHPALRKAIDHMLAEIVTLSCGKCTVGSLSYAELFINELSALLKGDTGTDPDTLIADKLIAINFNHILFFLFLDDHLKDAISELTVGGQLSALQQRKTFFEQLNPTVTYAANWKSIGEMMSGWIAEEIELRLKTLSASKLPVAQHDKLGFNLSVAQLACLTRALFSAGVYLSGNITETLTFSSRYFYSKKQPQISKGSFSKEYYSISQKTAAYVLDLLQKMTAQLKRDYFPLFLVTSLMRLFL